MTITLVSIIVDSNVARLAALMKDRYLILDRATGKPLDRNSYGKATRWAYTQRASALINTHRANTQIKPAVMYDAKTAQTFEVTA